MERKKRFTIKEWIPSERPREKMQMFGTDALSNAELLAILIGSGTPNESAVTLAARILERYDGNLQWLSNATVRELCRFKGIGPAKAITIRSAFSLHQRKDIPVGDEHSLFILRDTDSAVRLFREHHRGQRPLESWFMLANSDKRLLGLVQLPTYINNTKTFELENLIKTIQQHNASKLIFVQKVLQRDPLPSAAELQLFEELRHTAQVLGLEFMDFLMVSKGTHCSFAQLQLFHEKAS